MEVKTKYDKGDKVFFISVDYKALYEKKKRGLIYGEFFVAEGIVTDISIKCAQDGSPNIQYEVGYAKDMDRWIYEEFLFESVEALAEKVKSVYLLPTKYKT